MLKPATVPCLSEPSTETMRLPGATRSGFSRLSGCRAPLESVEPPRVGPRELKKLTLSSLRAAVSWVWAEPTVMTEGSLPGALMPP